MNNNNNIYEYTPNRYRISYEKDIFTIEFVDFNEDKYEPEIHTKTNMYVDDFKMFLNSLLDIVNEYNIVEERNIFSEILELRGEK